MPSLVEIISASDLEAMPTTSLLRRRKALLACEQSYEASDKVGYEPKANPSDTGQIEYKDSEEWISAYEELKAVLANREHVPRGPEKRAKGRLRAENRKLGERRSGRQRPNRR